MPHKFENVRFSNKIEVVLHFLLAVYIPGFFLMKSKLLPKAIMILTTNY